MGLVRRYTWVKSNKEVTDMQTVYFTTSNFIRHEGNMVDLTEYRRKLALAQGEAAGTEEPAVYVPRRRTNRRRRTLTLGAVLDCAASLVLIVTALSFMVSLF